MSRREVVISGRDVGLATVMDKLRRSSRELGRELIQEGLQNTKTSKDAIRYYEEQISLIEKRNKLHSEGLRQQAQVGLQERGDGVQSRQTYRSEVGQINLESKQDKIQIDLLRELIQTVKVTSQQEIRSDTSNQESQSNLIQRTSASQGQEFGDLQRRMFSEEETPETRSVSTSITQALGGLSSMGRQNTFGGVAATGLSTLGGMSAGRGAMGALAKAGMVAMVIAAISELINMPLAKRGSAEMSLSGYAGLFGGDVSSLEASGVGRTPLGGFGPLDVNVSRNQYIGYMTQLAKAGGKDSSHQEETWRAIEMSKLGVDMGTSVRALRYGRLGGGDSLSMGAQLYGGMSSGGVFGKDGRDLSRMSNFLETLVGLQEKQLMGTGVLGSNSNVNLLSRFANLGGKFERAEYAGSTVDMLNAGLRQKGTPEAEAIKMSILRKLNPEKGYFELQGEMQKGAGSEGYAKGVLDFVKGTGGTQDDQMILFQQLLGGSMDNQRILEMFKKGISFEDLEKDTTDKSFRKLARERTAGASSSAQAKIDIQGEAITNALSDLGLKIDTFTSAVTKLGKLIPSF